MPAAGIYDADELLLGPGDVYLMPTASAPATGVRLLIENGVPPDGLLFGYTTEGTRLVSTIETTGIIADESATPLKQRLDSETWAIEGTLMQIADAAYKKLQALLPQGRLAAPGFTFGGAASYDPLSEYCVVVIFPAPLNNAQYGYAILYKARNLAEFAMQISRVQEAQVDFRFEAATVGSRPAGDRVGHIVWDASVAVLGAAGAPLPLGTPAVPVAA